MKTFARDELVSHLRRIDESLSQSEDVILIGGAAMAIAYRVEISTRDIDLWSSMAAQRVAKVAQQLPVRIPLQAVGFADAPYEFESRLKRVKSLELTRLGVWVPDRHDLVFMKLARGLDRDYEGLELLHAARPLKLAKLLKIYHDETSHMLGKPGELETHVGEFVRTLFGKRGLARFKDIERLPGAREHKS